MPIYTYRREDGTTFEIRQKFSDDPLEVDPKTGQPVERIINNAAGVIFKGSGFYVTDTRGASRPAAKTSDSTGENGSSDASAGAKSDTPSETKSEPKSNTKAEKKAKEKSGS